MGTGLVGRGAFAFGQEDEKSGRLTRGMPPF